MTWDQYVTLIATGASAVAAVGAWWAAVASTKAANESNRITVALAARDRARADEAKSGVARAVLIVLDASTVRLAGYAARSRGGFVVAVESLRTMSMDLARDLRAQAARDAVQALGADVLNELEQCASACEVLAALTLDLALSGQPSVMADAAEGTARRCHEAGEQVAKLTPGERRDDFAHVQGLAHEIVDRLSAARQRKQGAISGQSTQPARAAGTSDGPAV